MFMGKWLRRAPKPLCMSAHTLRARARVGTLAGHSFLSGKDSATYSAMARVSHTARGWPVAFRWALSSSTGTLPTGLTLSMVWRKCEPASNESNRTICSVNGMPACVSSTQGRMDQEE